MLESVEEAFDQVPFAVQREIARPRDLAIGFWGDHRGDSPLDEAIDERIGIVGLVANQGIWIGAVDQRFCASQIVGLPWREYQVDGIAQGIDERVAMGQALVDASAAAHDMRSQGSMAASGSTCRQPFGLRIRERRAESSVEQPPRFDYDNWAA